MVWLLGEKLAVEFVALRVLVFALVCLLEQFLSVLGAGICDIVVGDEHTGILDPGSLKADRNVGIAVEIVHHVHRIGIGRSHAVHNDAQEGAALHVHVAVEQHECEQVVS